MRAIIAIYIVSVIYSVMRYVVFMPTNLENLPVFIVNKGCAMAAALCFMVGFIQQLRKLRGAAVDLSPPALWFRAGVFGAIVHIPISLAILRPGYFKEFFVRAADAGASSAIDHTARLSFAGEMVFLFGGLTAGLIFLLLRPTMSPRARWRVSLACMLTLLVHVLAMGYCRGLNINASYAYLPPMWLLSAIGIAAAVFVIAMSLPRGEGGEQR